MTETRLLRLDAVNERRARSRAQLYLDITAGLFPPPVKIGERLSAWPAREVETVIGAEIRGATPDELRALVRKLVAARRHAEEAAA